MASNRAIGWAIGVVCVAVFGTIWVSNSRSTLKVCNFAPYDSAHFVAMRQLGAIKKVSGWSEFYPGQCREYTESFLFGNPEFFVSTYLPKKSQGKFLHVNRIRVNELLNDSDPSNDEAAREASEFDGSEFHITGELLARATSLDVLLEKPQREKPVECPTDEQGGHFFSAYGIGAERNQYFFFESPNLALLQEGPTIEESIRDAFLAAYSLSNAIERQMSNIEKWPDPKPFGFGGNLYDFNGPLMRGVMIVDVVETSIFGAPMNLRGRDIINSIDGESTFGVADAYESLIKHGLSRSKGIDVAVDYTVDRLNEHGNWSYEKVQDTYFFNEAYGSNSENKDSIAFWYGIGDAPTFGQLPEVLCYGNNVLRGVVNAASATANFIDSEINDKPYHSTRAIEYIDASECTWQKEQLRGLARQKANDTYTDSQWFAILTPAAARVIGARLMGARAATAVSGRAIASRLSGTAWEVAETALRSLTTAPPGTPLTARFKEAIQLAPYAAGWGFLTAETLSTAKRASNSSRNRLRARR